MSNNQVFLKESDVIQDNTEKLVMRYVPLSKALLWDGNFKKHDIGSMIESIRIHGFRDAPIYDDTAGCIIAGNGRTIALQKMKDAHANLPRGILEKDGEWYLPVQFGVNANSQEEAYAFGIDHNNLTMLGGDIGIEDMKRIWDEEEFAEMAAMLTNAGVHFASIDGDDIDYLISSVDDMSDEGDSESSDNEDYSSWQIIIECDNATDLDNITAVMRSHNLKYKVVKKGNDNDLEEDEE